jgi:hypothetical protein
MQLVCLQWWGMLQLANARLRAYFFTASKGAFAGPQMDLTLPDGRGSD